MTKWRVYPTDGLAGIIAAPPSKSQSIRALLFGTLAAGESEIHGLLSSPDVDAMISACRAIGAQIIGKRVLGTGGKLKTPDQVIDCGGSGLVLRFVGAVAGLCNGHTVLTGDHAVRTRRVAAPLLKGIRQLGGTAFSTRNNGYAPLVIGGPIHPDRITIEGEDSQPVSALLIVASLLEGTTEICVSNPGEKPWVDLTLKWLGRLGVAVERTGHSFYRIRGIGSFPAFRYRVPGDFSSAAFPIVAAAILGAQVTVAGLNFNDGQGDKALLNSLAMMGAQVVQVGDAVSIRRQSLRAQKIDVNHMIDALPILAVAGCFAEGETVLHNGAVARHKESDRIAAICQELEKMGAQIRERSDGLVIRHAPLKGAVVNSHDDHRIAMALAVAALGAQGETTIEGVECVAKTYPNFATDLGKLGATIHTEGDHPDRIQGVRQDDSRRVSSKKTALAVSRS